MASESELLQALRAVDEPELSRSVVELGMVRAATLVGTTATVALALVLPPDWSETELRHRIVTALGRIAGVERVDIEVAAMTDVELAAAGAVLKGQGADPRQADPRQADPGQADPLHVVDASRVVAPPPRPRVNPFTSSSTRVLAISSGKGGVGKSSVTTNLAVALSRRGHDVAAVDADVWGFSMPRMLGVTRPPALVDDVIVPPSAHGVRLVSMGFFAREDQAVVWRGPMLHKALEQFITDVYWGAPDYLLVDMPPGTGDVAISIAQFLPRAEVVVVTTPQPAAQRVAQRAAAMAEKVDLRVIGVLENMSWFRGDDGKAYEIFGAGGGAELADELRVPLLGQIPLVAALREGGDAGRPIVVSEPESEAAREFEAAARRIDDELAPSRVYRSELQIR